MKSIIELYYALYIKVLLAFNPTMLFEKINQLEWYKKLLREWVDDCKLNNKVLEIGCSTGVLTQYLKSKGLTPHGVDLSEKSISSAQKQFDDISFNVENVLSLSYSSNSFNGVIAASVINIVGDKQKALEEMVRVCDSGGICSVLIPDSNFTERDFESLMQDLDISGFSLMALKTWNRLAPKMAPAEVMSCFQNKNIEELTEKRYLNGMVTSYTTTKKQSYFT